MERKITIEEHVLYKEDYQMKMLKANSPEGFLHVGGRGVNGSSYYDYDVSGKVSMQAMYARAKLKAEDIRHFMEQLGNVQGSGTLSSGYSLYPDGSGIHFL